MSDSDGKRPGSMSDADRALVGRERRVATPIHGVPIHVPHAEDFTPVTEVMALVDRIPDNETRELIGSIIAKTWRHTGNQEFCHNAAIERTDGAAIRAVLDDHVAADAETHREITESLADIQGKSGQNGKIGELRRRVDGLSSKAWWVLSAFVGGIGAAAIKLVMVVRAFDAVDARSEHNAAQLEILQAQVVTLQAALLARHRFPPAEAPERSSP